MMIRARPVQRVRVQRLPGADPQIALPTYETPGAAGMDVRANLAAEDRATGLTIPPGGRVLVPTGLSMAIPEGFEIQIRPRSGLALKHGVTLLNSPGTVDSDYRGPIGVILLNTGTAPYRVDHGARIAQLVLAPVLEANLVEVDQLGKTARRGGFGSTGI